MVSLLFCFTSRLVLRPLINTKCFYLCLLFARLLLLVPPPFLPLALPPLDRFLLFVFVSSRAPSSFLFIPQLLSIFCSLSSSMTSCTSLYLIVFSHLHYLLIFIFHILCLSLLLFSGFIYFIYCYIPHLPLPLPIFSIFHLLFLPFFSLYCFPSSSPSLASSPFFIYFFLLRNNFLFCLFPTSSPFTLSFSSRSPSSSPLFFLLLFFPVCLFLSSFLFFFFFCLLTRFLYFHLFLRPLLPLFLLLPVQVHCYFLHVCFPILHLPLLTFFCLLLLLLL